MLTKKNSTSLLHTIIEGIQETKGKNILSLDFAPIANSVCAYYVICSGDSNTHVNAIANSIGQFTEKKLDATAWHIEGSEHAQWIVMDYVNVVVHVFQHYYRDYYALEDLWADCVTNEYES